MQDRLKERIAQLKAEFDKGQATLAELEGQTREVQHTLLRISGAIQVLEELMAADTGGNGQGAAASEHTTAADVPSAVARPEAGPDFAVPSEAQPPPHGLSRRSEAQPR
jgi:hypothetical protein